MDQTNNTNMIKAFDKPQVSFKDWLKLDIRVGIILEAYDIVESNKMIKLIVDVGNKRLTLLSGSKTSFNPLDLVGKKILVAVNVKPKKTRFGISEGLALLVTFPGYESTCGRFLSSDINSAAVGMNI